MGRERERVLVVITKMRIELNKIHSERTLASLIKNNDVFNSRTRQLGDWVANIAIQIKIQLSNESQLPSKYAPKMGGLFVGCAEFQF